MAVGAERIAPRANVNNPSVRLIEIPPGEADQLNHILRPVVLTIIEG